MSRILFTCIVILFSCIKLYSQINNGKDFLDFAKTEFNSKKKILTQNKWSVINDNEKSIDEDGYNDIISVYEKKSNGSLYILSFDKKSHPKATINLYSTTIALPNEDTFNYWIANYEKLGYVFKKIKSIDAALFAIDIDKNLTIRAAIDIADDQSWIYLINIIIHEKK